MPMEELEGSLTVDHVTAVEELNLRAVGNPQLSVQTTHLGVFAGDPLIRRHAVTMAPFHHERSRCDQPRKLGMVERGPPD